MITEKLKAAGALMANWAPDVLMIGGAAAIAYGAGLIYTPASYIVAGLIAMAGGFLLARSNV